MTWVFAGTLFLPADPNVYSDTIVDAKPLQDGGWLVSHAAQVRPRSLCGPTSFGCGLVRRPLGTLQRLDATGRVVAQEHGAEPFGPIELNVFEPAGVVVTGGPWVRNGGLSAFRLDTLDGITTQDGNCVAIVSSCYDWRVDSRSGVATLKERAPADLHVVATRAEVAGVATMWPPALSPQANLFAWRAQSEIAPFVHTAPLDSSRLVAAPWRTRLEQACDVRRVADDRALVTYGPPSCHGDSGWQNELVEVSTGRVVRAFPLDTSFSGNDRRDILLADSGIAVDPRDGSDGPALAGGDPISIDWARGIAVAPLSDGGAAVYERRTLTPAPRELSFTTVAHGTCADYEYPRVMRAATPALKCPALAGSAGADRLLIATGRFATGPAAFTVTRVTADPATRVIDIRYTASGRRSNVTDASPASVIELAAPPSGEWLVRFMGEGADPYTARAYVVRFP